MHMVVASQPGRQRQLAVREEDNQYEKEGVKTFNGMDSDSYMTSLYSPRTLCHLKKTVPVLRRTHLSNTVVQEHHATSARHSPAIKP